MRYDDRELLELHADALYLTDARGRMTITKEPDGVRAPRVFLARGRAHVVWRLGATVDDHLAADLAPLLDDEPPASTLDEHRAPRHEETYRRLLGAASEEAWSGPAWWLPQQHSGVDAVLLGPDDLDFAAHGRGRRGRRGHRRRAYQPWPRHRRRRRVGRGGARQQ